MEEYRRWEENIKMDLKEIGVDVMNWMPETRREPFMYSQFVNADLI